MSRSIHELFLLLEEMLFGFLLNRRMRRYKDTEEEK
jgi:hypothetical protein